MTRHWPDYMQMMDEGTRLNVEPFNAAQAHSISATNGLLPARIEVLARLRVSAPLFESNGVDWNRSTSYQSLFVPLRAQVDVHHVFSRTAGDKALPAQQ